MSAFQPQPSCSITQSYLSLLLTPANIILLISILTRAGAASGIARITSRLLYSRGASLSLADLNTDGLKSVAAELASLSSSPDQKITTTSLDTRKSDQVNSWIENTVKDHGRLDGAANLAGVLKAKSFLVDTTDEEYEFMMGVNSTGV